MVTNFLILVLLIRLYYLKLLGKTDLLKKIITHIPKFYKIGHVFLNEMVKNIQGVFIL